MADSSLDGLMLFTSIVEGPLAVLKYVNTDSMRRPKGLLIAVNFYLKEAYGSDTLILNTVHFYCGGTSGSFKVC